MRHSHAHGKEPARAAGMQEQNAVVGLKRALLRHGNKAGKRFKMVRDLHAYIEGILTGGQVVDDLQEIPQRERAGEYLMTRLRTSRGILPQEYEKQYLLPFAPLERVLLRYADSGHAAKLENGHWRLTPEGFLISNTIITDLQIAQDGSSPLAKRR